MAVKYSNKINRIRTFALMMVFGGIIIMYVGLFFQTSQLIMTIFMLLGFLAVIGSSVVYFWIGMLSSRAVIVTCPTCEKQTKILGRVDACMHCDEPLTLDKTLEGKDFDEEYNKVKHFEGGPKDQ
ncbi:YgzB family protein [Salisediminibacterium selenitireducens]|uniref:UPF0295 protein Bsel_2715 n=1 Tax=Bacillus selenitireducens (strain ATCC 700615 / DSM 15326 / MLS10) TaxID=439292 RepID=D6XYE3_BACIE|nr:YgzB family protein [Salisediminibacterium selenitireducens]ADI00212.1 hypothetical protein Bsel_2715 [[Bacillus] selenitireducens MLS10]